MRSLRLIGLLLGLLIYPILTKAQYCGSSGPACNKEANSWIVNVSTNTGFNKASSCADGSGTAPGYSDFSTDTMKVSIGATFKLTVRPGNPFEADLMKVWIDFNGDGDFADTGEEITVSDSPGALDDGVYTVDIAVPTTQTAITSRIRIHTFDASANSNPGPCANTAYGEVEDYSIKFLNSTSSSPSYCASNSNCGPYAIDNVTIAGDNGTSINNNSACSGGYSDFSTLRVNVSAGNTYTLAVSCVSTTTASNAQGAVYIDWNDNGTFDANERSNATFLNGGFTFAITPEGASSGLKRMRICAGNGQALANPIPAACGARTDQGETEDYSLLLILPVDTIPDCIDKNKAYPANNAQNICQKITFKWNKANKATSYKFTLMQGSTKLVDNFSTTDTTYTYSANLNTGTIYRWIALPYAGTRAGIACDTLSFTTSSNADPAIAFSPSNPISICQGNTIPLGANPSLGTSPYTHSWNGKTPGSNAMLNDTAVASPNFSANLTSGTYKYGYQVKDANNCITRDTLTISIEPDAVAGNTAVNNPEICEGNSAVLSITGFDGSVSWESSIGGAPFAPVTLSSAGPDQYSTGVLTQTTKFRAIVQKGICSSTGNEVTVTVNPLPAKPIVNAPVTEACATQAIILTVTNCNNITWNDAANTNACSIQAMESSTYVATETDDKGCSNSSDPVNVTIYPVPAAPQIGNIGALSVCDGEEVVLYSNYTGGNSWSTGEQTDTIRLTQSATNVTLTYTDQNACSATSNPVTVTVNENPLSPIISLLNPGPLCEGNTYQFECNYNDGLLWSTGETSNQIEVNTSAIISVSYTDANGCKATSDDYDLQLNPLPAVPVITADGLMCEGSTVSLASNSLGNNVWSNGATTDTIFVTQSGDYGLTIVDVNGCENSSSYTLVMNALPAKPVINVDGLLCEGSTLTLSIDYTGDILWSTNENTAEIEVVDDGVYHVQITDNNGCSNVSDNLDIVFEALPAKPVIGQIGDSIFADVSGSTYRWYTDAGMVNNQSNQGFFPDQGGMYYVEVVSASGCTSPRSDAFFFTGTGISISLKGLPISLYPNPAIDFIQLEGDQLEQVKHIRLFHISGKEMAIENQKSRINVSTLDAGSYFISLELEQGVQVIPFLKK